MDQIETPHDSSNLSPLQVPDKVPLDRIPPQRLYFRKRLLEAVLTEDRQSCCYSLTDLVEPHRLCRRDEANAPVRPSGLLSRVLDPLEDELNILTN